jgi:hypothetical protein
MPFTGLIFVSFPLKKDENRVPNRKASRKKWFIIVLDLGYLSSQCHGIFIVVGV